MRRMIDAKKLKEIEANGGTKWYKHELSVASPAAPSMSVTIEFYSMFGESLKDVQLPNDVYVAIFTDSRGPSAPTVDTAFPVFLISSGTFMLKYLGTDGSLQRYQFEKSSIKSDVVTKA